MSVPALRALLDGLIDYAGLFPPAAVSMAEAVANHAAYRAGADAWALGRFVVPVSRLEEFIAERSVVPGDVPWRLSALAQAADLDTMRTFNNCHRDRAVIDAIEVRAQAPHGVAAVAPLGALAPVFVEVPVHDDPDALVQAIAAHGLRAKIRTGGVTADAFPSATAIARFLGACVRHGVPFKATAGLHHPLCGVYPLTYAADAGRAVMYGYLNVFLAALFAHAGMDEADIERLLGERDPDAFVFDAHGARWGVHQLRADALADGRATFALSFGSCSFREPLDDLSSLYPT